MNALVLLVIALATVAVSRTVSNPPFRYITAVDGKAFFSEITVPRTWIGAKQYCQDQGMQLASVENVAQRDGLHAVYNVDTFAGDFWTSGRDSLSRTQFKWDGRNESIISSETDSFFRANDNLSIQTCIYFSNQASEATISPDQCTQEKLTFCEVNTN